MDLWVHHREGFRAFIFRATYRESLQQALKMGWEGEEKPLVKKKN